MRHIFYICLFKDSFLSNSFIYKFVHAIIFLFIERKAISCLSVEFAKNLAVLELLIHFIKSSAVACKRVAYKKNLVYSLYSSQWFPSKKSFKWKNCKIIRGVFRTLWKSSRCLTGFLNKPLVVAASYYKRLHLSNKMCLIWEYLTKVLSV